MKSFFDGIRPSPAVMKFFEGIVSTHGPVTLTCSTRWPSANPHCYSKKEHPWHNADQGEWKLRGFYSGADWPPTSVPYQLPAGLAGLAGPTQGGGGRQHKRCGSGAWEERYNAAVGTENL